VAALQARTDALAGQRPAGGTSLGGAVDGPPAQPRPPSARSRRLLGGSTGGGSAGGAAADASAPAAAACADAEQEPLLKAAAEPLRQRDAAIDALLAAARPLLALPAVAECVASGGAAAAEGARLAAAEAGPGGAEAEGSLAECLLALGAARLALGAGERERRALQEE
jgi:hypothetical protein